MSVEAVRCGHCRGRGYQEDYDTGEKEECNVCEGSGVGTMPLMEGYETARDAAIRLGYDYTFFTRKLNRGEIPGARKFQQVWIVPSDVTREQVERPIGRPKKGSGEAPRENREEEDK